MKIFNYYYQLHLIFIICIIVLIDSSSVDKDVIPTTVDLVSSVTYSDESYTNYFVRQHIRLENDQRHIYISPLALLDVQKTKMIQNSITNRTTMIIPLILYMDKQIQIIIKINFNQCIRNQIECTFYRILTNTMSITNNQTNSFDIYRQYINSLWITNDLLSNRQLYINMDCISNETCLKLTKFFYQSIHSTNLHLQYSIEQTKQNQLIINKQNLYKTKFYSLEFIFEHDIEEFLKEILDTTNVNENNKYILSDIDLFLLKQTLKEQLLDKIMFLNFDNNEKQWNLISLPTNNTNQFIGKKKINFKYLWKRTTTTTINNNNTNDEILNYIQQIYDQENFDLYYTNNTQDLSNSLKIKPILVYQLNKLKSINFRVSQLIHLTKKEDIYSIPIRSFLPINQDLQSHNNKSFRVSDNQNKDNDQIETTITMTETTEQTDIIQDSTIYEPTESSSIYTTTQNINHEWFDQASCILGKYLYKDQCILCTPGYYCPNGESRIRCPRGQIAPGYGFTSCQQCPTGWYSTCETQESCLVCPKGFYCPTKNQQPQPCPIGYYSSYGATQCTRCPSGYYTTYTNSSYCLQCPIGYSCLNPTKCPQPCPAGTYQPNIMSISCVTCPVGHSCGRTTNLLQCTTTSCIQAETSTCDSSQSSPPSSVCTNIG